MPVEIYTKEFYKICDLALEQLVAGDKSRTVVVASVVMEQDIDEASALKAIRFLSAAGWIGLSENFNDQGGSFWALFGQRNKIRVFLDSGGYQAQYIAKLEDDEKKLRAENLRSQELELSIQAMVDAASERYENKWKRSDTIAAVAALIAFLALIVAYMDYRKP
ncbi:hypothetical protein ACE38W_14875 [Chitinophaga sp. Hz27]|uniref:hypothetical protein n=1 Tax=Chitinophaga sp. Hz27 TaxID=3347169 RepID=UPI0035D7D67D